MVGEKFGFKINLQGTFEAFDADTVEWEDGQIVAGRKLWEKGKNTCLILEDSYQIRLWQVMCFGQSFIDDFSGYPKHRGKRAKPFQYMQLGDGTECIDAAFPDLVHPCTASDATYDYSRVFESDMYQPGSYRQCDQCDIGDYDADSSAVFVTHLYHFGTEHCNDRLIAEWGLFSTLKLQDGTNALGVPEYENFRVYLNRNNLDPAEQFTKHSNMIIRAMIRIYMGF